MWEQAGVCVSVPALAVAPVTCLQPHGPSVAELEQNPGVPTPTLSSLDHASCAGHAEEKGKQLLKVHGGPVPSRSCSELWGAHVLGAGPWSQPPFLRKRLKKPHLCAASLLPFSNSSCLEQSWGFAHSLMDLCSVPGW